MPTLQLESYCFKSLFLYLSLKLVFGKNEYSNLHVYVANNWWSPVNKKARIKRPVVQLEKKTKEFLTMSIF